MSLECVGEMTELTRFGSNWNQVDKNINKWLEQDWINFNFNTAFNALTLSDAANYISYLVNLYNKHKRKISISPNVVYEPDGLEPSVLDNSFEIYIKNALTILSNNTHCFEDDEGIGWQRLAQNLENISNSLGNNTEKKKNLKVYLTYMNKLRGIDINNSFPLVVKYLKNT